jgi:hypothetical protein
VVGRPNHGVRDVPLKPIIRDKRAGFHKLQAQPIKSSAATTSTPAETGALPCTPRQERVPDSCHHQRRPDAEAAPTPPGRAAPTAQISSPPETHHNEYREPPPPRLSGSPARTLLGRLRSLAPERDCPHRV